MCVILSEALPWKDYMNMKWCHWGILYICHRGNFSANECKITIAVGQSYVSAWEPTGSTLNQYARLSFALLFFHVTILFYEWYIPSGGVFFLTVWQSSFKQQQDKGLVHFRVNIVYWKELTVICPCPRSNCCWITGKIDIVLLCPTPETNKLDNNCLCSLPNYLPANYSFPFGS